MKRTGKYILIMLAVLLVLGGAVALLTLLPTEEGEESSLAEESAAEQITLLDRDPAEVKSVEVENSTGSFSLVPVKSGSDVSFTLKDYEEYDLNTSLLTANVRTLLTLRASKDLGGREDLDAFGLGKDAASVTISYSGGDSETLLLGGNAGESVGKYVLKDNTVYIASGVPVNLFDSKFSYFNTSIYIVPDRVEITEDQEGGEQETTAVDILYSATLSGAAFPEPVSMEYTDKATSTYLITEPIMAETGNSSFDELVAALKTLTADSVVEAGLTEEVLRRYGLDEPDAQVSFNMNDSEHTLAVSAKDSGGNRYLLADGRDVVYQVSNSLVEKWAESSVSSLRMSYVWIPNIKNVEKLRITVDGDQVYEYHITRTKNEEKSTEDTIQYDLTVKNAGGEDVSYADAYQPFYQKLISLAVFSQDQGELEAAPEVKAVYEYFGGGSDTVELYKVKDGNRYAAMLNGKFNGQIRGTEVSAMRETIPG